MNLVKTLVTSSLIIKIYSINPNLIVSDDITIFEHKNDNEIQSIVFNQLGAEEVSISDIDSEGSPLNTRSYALV